jgi:hypothetical protein
MTAPDTATLLDQTRQAISDLLTTGTASYGESGQTFTMLDLARLQSLESMLTQRLGIEQGGSFRLVRPMRQR